MLNQKFHNPLQNMHYKNTVGFNRETQKQSQDFIDDKRTLRVFIV